MPNKEEAQYYLAYGSNLNIQNMLSHCPEALLLEAEQLHGYRLVFRGPRNGEAWLTLASAPDQSVPVALWQLSWQDVENLRAFEECPLQHDEIHLILGRRHCFTYVLRPNYPFSTPSEEYYRMVEEGYQEMGFDLLHLQQALLNR